MSFRDIDAPLSLEVCEKLKELGFPQNHYPQLIREKMPAPYMDGTTHQLVWKRRAPLHPLFVAAPTPLTVLAWMEESYGVLCGHTGSEGPGTWWASWVSPDDDELGWAEGAANPSELQSKIIAAMEVKT